MVTSSILYELLQAHQEQQTDGESLSRLMLAPVYRRTAPS